MLINFLAETPLFSGASPEEIQDMLDCLGARRRTFQKEEVIYHAGDRISSLGLVLSGSVRIESVDVWGNQSVLSQAGPGQVFAETYACLPGEPLMVSAVSARTSEILFLQTARLLHPCTGACPHHERLLQNLLTVTARKNLLLSRRMFHTSPKTIRGRLLSYLSDEAIRQNSRSLTLPFNRQQLADYLEVDRSALSGELGKMRREGLLDFRKNWFLLK